MAGMSSLALQVIPLASVCQGDSDAVAKATAVLVSLVDRALAYPGDRPDNLRPASRRNGNGRLNRRGLFGLRALGYTPVPTVEHAHCAAPRGCRRCVDTCPHAALELDGDAIEVRREGCSGCGRCVAECPQRTIDMPGWSAGEIETQVNALLGESPGRPLAYLCADSPVPGGRWLPVRVRCASTLPAAAILGPLAVGAPAVALAPCGTSCDASQPDARLARIDYYRSLLVAAGQDPERVGVLGTQRAETAAGTLAPLPGDAAPAPLRIFGRGADARAVLALSARLGNSQFRLEHPASPLGMVAFETQACTTCGVCAGVCPTAAIVCEADAGTISLRFDPRLCTRCGECLARCPEWYAGAITLEPVTDVAELGRGERQVARAERKLCRRCGAHVASSRVLTRVAAVLGDQYRPEIMAELCPSCRWA
ncbi:MAG: hypothetical protein Kow0010_22570 [Dehalococcoidia bacterium]